MVIMRKLVRHIPLLLLVLILTLASCGVNKNTAGSRFWQAMNTRYNVYYHGKTHYDEQIKELENEYEDDYSQRVFIHPAEARSNPKSPQPKGNFDRTIEKMQKAITLHSIKKKPNKKGGKQSDPKYREWMAREEYNPFLHNAWYLLAKSEYMKGDFLEASATFRYIYRHFQWKPNLAQEAQVWEALCYTAMGWNTEADNVLAHIHLDKIEDDRIRGLANLAFADYYIKEHSIEQAIPYLEEAVKKTGGAQKVRLNFLLGQLYEQTDEPELAYQAYKRAGSSNSSSYRTKFNARIKQSAVFQGYDIAKEVRALRAMTRYDRNKDYLDQIYYAIGNLYLTREDTVKAIESYVKAAEKSTRNGIDKAISQLTLGGVYFAQHKYDKAQPCYAEAIPHLNEDYPNYKMLKHRSDVLDELAVYAQNVTLQDSLLRLSKMSDEEVKKVIKKIIDELKKKEKEEKENAAREEYMAKQEAKGDQMGKSDKSPQSFNINNDKSWYFYNKGTINAGKTDFQQRWGNRKLEDNWRRRNKNTFSFDDEANLNDSTRMAMGDSLSGDSTKVDKEAMRRAEDPHYEEYYLKQIPKTEEQIQAANDIIQEGLYNMGVILKDKLEDFEASASQFNELLTRYPDNIYRLDTYYNMYLMFMRSGQTSRANVYRDLITSEFADSKYGQALQDPNYFDNLKNMNRDQENMYEAAYANYLADNNEAVHEAYAEMMSKYPLSKIMPKFMFIDALSYVTQRQYDKFKEVLKDLLTRYPETDITPTASAIAKQLKAGRKLNGGGSNARGMLWSTRLSNDTTPGALERKFTPFAADNDKPQVFILLYPIDSVSTNLLLYEVARHNFTSFKVKDYDLEQMTFGRLGLLVVKGFQNFDEVKHYRTIFENDEDMAIPPQVHIVLISDQNFQLLLNEGRSFEEYFDYLEGKVEEKVEDNSDSGFDFDIPEVKDNSNNSKDGSRRDSKDSMRDSKRTKDDSKPAVEPGDFGNFGNKPDKSDEKPGKPDKPVEKPDKPDKPDKPIDKPDKPVEKTDKPERPADKSDKPSDKPVEKSDKPDKPEIDTPSDTTVVDAQTKPDEKSEKSDKSEVSEPSGKSTKSVKPSKPEKPQVNKDDYLGNVSEKQRERYEAKERERAAKQREKERKEAEKEAKRLKEQQEQMRQDSIRQAEKERERALREADKARENRHKHRADSVKNLQKEREDAIKQEAKNKEEERKLKEKERKEQAKLKQEERKQREKERKERQKAKEKERKEKAKVRKQQQKEKEKAAKQRQKEREAERKAKAKEREQERKGKKSGKGGKPSTPSNTNTSQASSQSQTPSAGTSTSTLDDMSQGNSPVGDVPVTAEPATNSDPVVDDSNNNNASANGSTPAAGDPPRSVRNRKKD